LLFLKIYRSFDLNKNQRPKLLKSIKNNVSKNNGFLKSINKLLNEKGENLNNTITVNKNNTLLSNINVKPNNNANKNLNAK